MNNFKEILKEMLPLIESKPSFKESYLKLISDDVENYNINIKNYFNPEEIYKKFYLKFKKYPVLPDSLKFIKIAYYASKNIPLDKCVEELKDEIDVLNGYFKENLAEDIKSIRREVDIATFLIVNFSYKEVFTRYKSSKLLELLQKEFSKMKIANDFIEVKDWKEKYENTTGMDEYNLLTDYLDILIESYPEFSDGKTINNNSIAKSSETKDGNKQKRISRKKRETIDLDDLDF